MKNNNYAGIDPHIVTVIAREVRKLVGRHGIVDADIADIEQDLHLSVWSALQELQDVAFEAAVHQIVNHKVIDIIRSRKCMCRDWRCDAFSLNASAPDAEDSDDELADILDLEETLGGPPSWHQRRAEAADIAEALASLPDDLRALAFSMLASGGNEMAAARDLGIGRKKARCLHDRLRKVLAWLRD